MVKTKRTGGRRKGWYYRMSFAQKRGLWGVLFLAPWLLGFMLFYLGPLVDTVRYSFSDVSVTLGQVEMEWIGLTNYVQSFTVDPLFNRYILTLAFPALFNVAIVVIFSLLTAILINGKFPGRSIIRTIFFIPIVMGAVLAAQATTGMVGDDEITAATGFFGFSGVSGDFFLAALAATGLPADITNYVNLAITGIFDVLANAGVPVLIFLAGLQSIPASLYEVAKIEGSTAYESFWKVTLPMISPMILLSTVYTVVEQFNRHRLPDAGLPAQGTFLGRIQVIGTNQGNIGMASAQVTIFVLATMLIIGLLTWIISKGVFYYD